MDGGCKGNMALIEGWKMVVGDLDADERWCSNSLLRKKERVKIPVKLLVLHVQTALVHHHHHEHLAPSRTISSPLPQSLVYLASVSDFHAVSVSLSLYLVSTYTCLVPASPRPACLHTLPPLLPATFMSCRCAGYTS
ncbi:hypothetical protein ACJQWK_06340 [Exserohilum turcicum]